MLGYSLKQAAVHWPSFLNTSSSGHCFLCLFGLKPHRARRALGKFGSYSFSVASPEKGRITGLWNFEMHDAYSSCAHEYVRRQETLKQRKGQKNGERKIEKETRRHRRRCWWPLSAARWIETNQGADGQSHNQSWCWLMAALWQRIDEVKIDASVPGCLLPGRPKDTTRLMWCFHDDYIVYDSI